MVMTDEGSEIEHNLAECADCVRIARALHKRAAAPDLGRGARLFEGRWAGYDGFTAVP